MKQKPGHRVESLEQRRMLSGPGEPMNDNENITADTQQHTAAHNDAPVKFDTVHSGEVDRNDNLRAEGESVTLTFTATSQAQLDKFLLDSGLASDQSLAILASKLGITLLEDDPPQLLPPKIQVSVGAIEIPDNTGEVDFGATLVGKPIERAFWIKNVGEQDLELDSLVVPAGFTATFVSAAIAPGLSVPFLMTLDATVAGPFGGEVSFTTNDPSSGTFNFVVDGLVTTPTPTPPPGHPQAGTRATDFVAIE